MNTRDKTIERTRTTPRGAAGSPSASPHGHDGRSNRFWTWSLKSGGRYVGFESRLQLEAFVYLSAQHGCTRIAAHPVDPASPLPGSVQRLISIGTCDQDGQQCLYGVKESDSSLNDVTGRQWRQATRMARACGKRFRIIRRSDLSRHQQLIRNWLRMMDGVRTAELDPDFELRCEIIARASHPEGISIGSAVEDVAPDERRCVIAQIYWLIHEQELLADLATAPLSMDLHLSRSMHH